MTDFGAAREDEPRDVKSNRFIKAVSERGASRGDTSPLYRWMWDNFEAIAEAKALYKKWDVYLDLAAQDGITKTALGEVLSPSVATRTWRRVRQAKQRQAAHEEGKHPVARRDRGALPSRASSDWSPPTVQTAPGADVEKDSSVARKAGTLSNVEKPLTPTEKDAASDELLGMDVLETLARRRKRRGEGFMME